MHLRGRSQLLLLFLLLNLLLRLLDLLLSFCRLLFALQFLVHFHGVISVNGCEVVFHGNCLKAHLFAGIRKLGGYCEVSVIALCIIAEEHVPFASVLKNILGHSQVARAVAEYENRAFADLIDDREHFVGILVFGDKIAFHQDLVIRGNCVFAAGFCALAGCDE